MSPTRTHCSPSRPTWTLHVIASSISILLLRIRATGKSSSLNMTRMLLVSFCSTCDHLDWRIWIEQQTEIRIVSFPHLLLQCLRPVRTPASCLCVSSTTWKTCWKCTAWALGRNCGRSLWTWARWWVSQDGRGTLRSSTISHPSSRQVYPVWVRYLWKTF